MVVAWLGLGLGLAGLGGLVPLLKYVYRQAPFLGESFVARAAGPLYACLVCGIAAVIITLLLLGDIRRGEVFTATNVRRLRLISYCGYAITLACVVGLIVANPWLLFAFIGLVAGFMSLLMRVIKNVIDTARLLKEDADFTI
jgi:hypothetical protein